jgi:hypothetical protein
VRLNFTIECGVHLVKFMNLLSAVAGVVVLANLFLERVLLFFFFFLTVLCVTLLQSSEVTKGICTTTVEGIPFRGQVS